MSAILVSTPLNGVTEILHNVDTVPPFISTWCGRWVYGERVLFRGCEAFVYSAFPDDIPTDHVPIVLKPEDTVLLVVSALELEPREQ